MIRNIVAVMCLITLATTVYVKVNHNDVQVIEKTPEKNIVEIAEEKVYNDNIQEDKTNILSVRTQEKTVKVSDIEANITYNSNNLLDTSNTTLYHIKKTLEGTTMYELSEYFYNAEQKYGINVFFLMSIVALESGWNTSTRAITQNNLTGHAVYSRHSRGSTFSSKEQCILDTAKMLKENYLTVGAIHFNGYSTQDINKKYSTDKKWSTKVNQIAGELVEKVNR